jgi:PHD/YefM family antitoxin component YafN of YafNO toxin-antitoxin module
MVNIVRIKEVEENVVLRKADFENLIDVVESLMETLEVLSDKNLMKQIRESETDIEEGKTFEIKTEDDLNNLFVG